MQNHEPWDHHTQEKMPVSTEWKQLKFTFVAPWDDNNVRISFTDLATAPDQVYWFANCSLVAGPPNPLQHSLNFEQRRNKKQLII
jgi:hypothetical protein